MRNLFLALLLANLGFAAWSAWFAQTEPARPRVDSGLPLLTLVNEVQADPRGSERAAEPESRDAPSRALPTAAEADGETDESPPAVEAATPSVVTAARCRSIGPFRELSQAAAAAATLRGVGHQPAQRVAEGEVWIGYWVYIPGIATEREANDIVAKVRVEGITDSYVIPNSDSGNLVSLGVFSEISGVARRREQVRALGYEPQVVDRTRRATVYWVDVMLAAGQTFDFDALQPAGRIIRLEQRDCDRPAA